MERPFALLASCGLLAAASCTTVASDAEVSMPLFAKFDPSPEGEQQIRLTAGIPGRLEVEGQCLVLRGRGGITFTPIFHEEAEIGRDARGLFVRDNRTGAVIRPGDRVYGGGAIWQPGVEGRQTLEELNARITPDLPPECGQRVAGFHNFERSNWR